VSGASVLEYCHFDFQDYSKLITIAYFDQRSVCLLVISYQWLQILNTGLRHRHHFQIGGNIVAAALITSYHSVKAA